MDIPLRVLIVEDSEDDTLLMVRELQQGGYAPTFERVETPEAMKASLEKQSWDLIIADYTLPHFSGLAALKMLKESGLDLPFIIVSGTIGEDVAVGVMKAGAHDYIMKNNLPRLIPTIERELRDVLTRQDRKKGEEALKDSEEKYRTLVDHSLQGIVVAQGPSPRLIFVNPAMSRILGFTSDELLSLSSKKLENLVHPEDREFFFKSFRDRLEGKEVPQNYEVRGIRKDGSVCWLAISGNRIEYKGKPAVQAAFIDITERKQAEKAFKDSERLSWAVLETAPSLIFLTDEEGHIFLFNRACEELTGYKREEVIGKTIPELFLPPQWIPIVQKRFADPYAPEVRVPHESPWRTKSGEERLIEWRCTVLPSPVDGSPHVLGTGIDITERKRAEEALNQLKERYRTLVEESFDGIFVQKGQKIVFANHRLYEMLGYDAGELEGKDHWIVYHPDYQSLTRDRALARMRGETVPFQYEVRLQRKDGSAFDGEVNARRIMFDKEPGIQVWVRDITERKQAEEAVKESEERYRNLFENAIDGIALADAETGILIDCNKAIENLVNRGRAELIGQSQKILHPPEDNTGEVSRSFAQHRFDKKGQLLETQVITKTGERKHVEIKANVIELKGGRVLQGIFRDITERKQAEQALFDSEQRYRILVDNVPDVIFALAPDGTVTSLNPAFESITGWPRSEWLHKQFAPILHPDDLSRGLELFQRALKGGKTATFQLRVLSKSGDYLVGEFMVTPQTQSGSVIGIVGIARDITDRKRAEEELRESEERYRSLFDGIPIGLYRTNSAGEILDANPALVEMLGYPDWESLSKVKVAGTDIDPEERKRWLTLMEQEGIVRSFQRQLRRCDGSVIWVEENARVVRSADSRGLYHYEGSFQDITERKRAEESLKQSEENARQLAQENAVMAEIAQIISSTLNIDEVYERFAEEVRKMIPLDRISVNIINPDRISVTITYSFGVRIEDHEEGICLPLDGPFFEYILNRQSGFLIHPQDENELAERYPNLLRHFRVGIRTMMAVPLISKDRVIGILHIQSLKPNAYMESDLRLAERVGNQIAGAIANSQLFTERLRAEEEKAALQEQLRQSQKMEAIGRLAGGVAHDFNNLLTIIKGNSELTLMDLGKDDPLRENLEGVLRASGRASGLIRQLLAFSRRQVMEMRVLDLNTVLEDLDKMLRRIIGEDIELITLASKDLGRIKADAGQIEQVILNLAVNSRDAMPSGGRLTIETANAELDEEYARRHIAVIPGRYVMLSVSDTGVGMIPEVRDKVFEPFFTTKESSKGTGLGLSTVYGIVKQSGGNIWVYSEPGKGTTFKIYLPRVDEPLGEVVREKAAANGLPRGSETILIVEDDEDVREVAVRILKMQGYRVLETSQGSDALHHCEQEAGPIHLMVTDVVMPGMNGPELAKRLSPLRPEMKVLYISGYTDNAIVHHGVLEKGVNYIQKPFTVEGLVRKVREVLDR